MPTSLTPKVTFWNTSLTNLPKQEHNFHFRLKTVKLYQLEPIVSDIKGKTITSDTRQQKAREFLSNKPQLANTNQFFDQTSATFAKFEKRRN